MRLETRYCTDEEKEERDLEDNEFHGKFNKINKCNGLHLIPERDSAINY